MSELNIELLTKVRDKIATTPEAYDQSVYGRISKEAPCGTAACIAGWTVLLADAMPVTEVQKANGAAWAKEQNENREVVGNLLNEVPRIAAELLGLTDNEKNILFIGEPEGDESEYDDERDGGWPEPFATDWAEANGQREQAQVAVAYLDHIIATGEVL